MQVHLKSISSVQTEKIAVEIGRSLRGSETIELVSDLGGGKTTFVRGLARGLGSKDLVRSPSFTIANEYKSNNLTLHHFDFYRLDEPGIIAHEISELGTDPNAIIVIEWAKGMDKILPASRLKVEIHVVSEDSRDIMIQYPKAFTYLINKVT